MIRSIHSILKFFLRNEYQAFLSALNAPRRSQRKLFRRLLTQLKGTEYGRKFQIDGRESVVEFQKKLPLTTYEDISSFVESMQAGKTDVLTKEPIRCFERTSGSSGKSKLIPYSSSLRNSFSRMAKLWIYDLLSFGPKLKGGPIYFSVSPQFQLPEQTQGGVPIGLEDDSDYLNSYLKYLLKFFFAVPADLKSLQDPNEFKRVLSCYLLSSKNLEVVSVWNPSFITILLDFIRNNRREILLDLASGNTKTKSGTFNYSFVSEERLLKIHRGDPWEEIWPKLKIISAWSDASAKSDSQRLKKEFPNVYFQGKGLLATEAPLSLPMVNANSPVPLVQDIFYEFIYENRNVKLLHELKEGDEVEIVFSHLGGLTRYRILDRIRVTGFFRNTPCFEFIGRGNSVSDLVGEKLNEEFVQRELQSIPEISQSFLTLLPYKDGEGKGRYYLLTENKEFETLADAIEDKLSQAYHYRQARLLGQLAKVSVLSHPNARDLYYQHFVDKGLRWGDIKHRYLLSNLDDSQKMIEKSLVHR